MRHADMEKMCGKGASDTVNKKIKAKEKKKKKKREKEFYFLYLEGGQGILSPTSTKWIPERLNDRAHGGNRGQYLRRE